MSDSKLNIESVASLLNVLAPESGESVEPYFSPANLKATSELLTRIYVYVVEYYEATQCIVPFRILSRRYGVVFSRLRSAIGPQITLLSLLSAASERGFPLRILNTDGRRNLVTTPLIYDTNYNVVARHHDKLSEHGYSIDLESFLLGESAGLPFENTISEKFKENLSVEISDLKDLVKDLTVTESSTP